MDSIQMSEIIDNKLVQNVPDVNACADDQYSSEKPDSMIRKKPLIQNSSLWINSSESDPMGLRFKIDSTDFLDKISDRSLCGRCLKSRRFYCYTCYQPLDVIKDRVPKIRLPVKVDIIKHIQEVDGKSTSCHAVIIAPEDCSIYTFPDIPDWTDQRVVLVFPGPNAQTLNQLFDDYYSEEKHKICGNWSQDSNSKLPFDRVVFIDSTWRQTRRILSDPRVSQLKNRTVVLSTHDSLFWRHQRSTPRTYLSTIEAIYYFFVDFHQILDEKQNNRPKNSGQYDQRYDNLLFFFKHTYNKLRQKYKI